MKTSNRLQIVVVFLCAAQNGFAQAGNADIAKDADKTATAISIKPVEASKTPETTASLKSNINGINGGMPNRISMNVTVAKQTQGATFGEKVNAGKIDVVLVKDGCIVLFPSNSGYKINTIQKSIKELSGNESAVLGEKVNAGPHAAGGALSQGASLLGGAMPGGAVISAAVSSVGNLAGGAGAGAAAASYARTGNQVWKMEGKQSEATLELPEGDFELVFVVVETATSGLKDTLKTQVRLGFSIAKGVLKTKHDTAKNSVGNIR